MDKKAALLAVVLAVVGLLALLWPVVSGHMLDTLEDMGYDVERLRPEGKDWNDDLRAKRGKAKTPTA